MTTKLPRHRVVIVAVSLLVCALAFGWTVVQSVRQGEEMDRQAEQINALYDGLVLEQEGVKERGDEPVAPAPEELIEDPEAEIPEPVGPSDEQVLAAVEAYFREHPVEDGEDGADASPAAITAAVVNYLTQNPPEPGEPGPPPTADQILAAVAAYLELNPPPEGPQGPPGEDGEDGHTPTSEEIQAELAAYLEANPIKRCDDGWEYTVVTVLTTGPPTDINVCVRQS